MRLSNLADYAVVLMSAAARQCGSHYGSGPIHAGMLAEQHRKIAEPGSATN